MTINVNLKVSFSAVLLASCIFMLQGCKKRYQITSSAYIIGPTNDISPVTPANRDLISPDHLNAAVVFVTDLGNQKRKFCSGTLIASAQPDAPYRVLSNHHCFIEAEGEIEREGLPLINIGCKNTTVFFGFLKGQTDNAERSQCDPNSFHSDPHADLAIFTLTKNPSSLYKPAAIWQEDEIPPGRAAKVIHFPKIEETDPLFAENMLPVNGLPDLRLPVAQLTVNDCNVVGRFPEDEWELDSALSMGVKHTCDQMKGSSGSALWDADLNIILGINWGGITLKYSSPPRTEIYNVATMASYVRAFIKSSESSQPGVSETSRISSNFAPSRSNLDSTLVEKKQSGNHKTKLTGCGVVGSTSHLTWHFTLFILLFPVIALQLRRLFVKK